MSKSQTGNPSRPGVPFITCPHCHVGDLCPRRRQGAVEWLLMLVRLKPYRCSQCGARVFRRD